MGNELCSLGSASTPSISWSIPTTSRSLLWLLLRCSPHLPTPPDDHQPPAPLLLGRHRGLRHLLLHHRLPLLPLQPPRLPHPVRPLRGARPLSPPHALAPRARRPSPLLRHLLPPPCLRPLPPPALPAQAPCSRPASWRSRLGCPVHRFQHSLEPTYEPQPLPVLISCSIVFSINTLVHGLKYILE